MEYIVDSSPVFGKFMSLTPDGKYARVAVRGDNTIFARELGSGAATDMMPLLLLILEKVYWVEAIPIMAESNMVERFDQECR